MVPTLVISFREGLEAFLVVAVTLMYLRQTQRYHLASAVFAAIGVALLACIALGIALARIGAWTPFWEGLLSLIAALLIISCIAHILKLSKNLKDQIEARVAQPARHRLSAYFGVFFFVAFMISREGIEAATSMASLAQEADTRGLIVAAVVGLLAAATVALLWTRMSHRIDLGRFFQFTSVFLGVFAVQLLIKSFHEFTEGDLIPWIDDAYWHIATEPFGPDGPYGAYLSYAIAILPVFWLLSARGSTAQRTRTS